MQTSPPHSHQAQGCVERYHKTLFAQLRTLEFSVNNTTWAHATSAHTVHYSTIYYTTQLGYSTDIYVIAMGKLHTRETGNDHTQHTVHTINPSSHLEKRSTWRNSCQRTGKPTTEIKNKSTKLSGLAETQQQANTSHSQRILS
eukprot:3598768-Amphidinium_carterae.1